MTVRASVHDFLSEAFEILLMDTANHRLFVRVGMPGTMLLQSKIIRRIWTRV
jgi:hypothetical protein